MFRYVAIAWNSADPQQEAAANDISLTLRRQPGWHAALLGPGLHVCSTGTTPRNNAVRVLRTDTGAAVILGRLFRRTDCDGAPAPEARLDTATAPELAGIVASRGRQLVEQSWGRYVALVQEAAGTVLVLRDPSGALPCFLTQHHGVTVVFSWLEDILQTLGPEAAFSVNWDALTAQVLHGQLGGRETALAEVTQVLPGECLELASGRSTLLWRAVQFARSPARYSDAEAEQLLGHTVRTCTRSWAACHDAILLRLSGGVDSSILLSCLSPAGTPTDVICVNYHSPGSDSDERPYALQAAGRIGRDLLLRERDTGFPLERVMHCARMPSPVFYLGAMNASTDARLASAHGATAMFTGAGGDTVFYELLRWWPAADYLHDHGLDSGFPAAALDAARLGRLSVWRTLRLACRERLRPDLTARIPTSYAGLLTADLARMNLPRERFVHPALADSQDLPIGKYMQTAAVLHPVGYYDPFEQASAPEQVHPLLSQPLVELCLSLPSYQLTRSGQGRALARRAFAAELPPAIASRRTKGGMEEHIKAVLQSNIELVRSLLLDGELSRRRLLDRAKIEQILSGGPSRLNWSPTQVHGLVAVEAWLSRWGR